MPTLTTNHHDAMLTTAQAAEALGLKTQTMHEWRCRGVGPAFHRLGRAIRYSLADLADWLAASRIEPRDPAEVD